MSEFVDKRLLMVALRTILSFSMFLVFVAFAQGQQPVVLSDADCDQKLAQADAELNAGHFYSIPSVLKDCLDGEGCRTTNWCRLT